MNGRSGLFLGVTELCGDVVILGRVHRAEYRDGALTIRGLDLEHAVGILGALATSSLVTASVSGLLPKAPPVMGEAPAPAPPVAPVQTPSSPVAQAVAQHVSEGIASRAPEAPMPSASAPSAPPVAAPAAISAPVEAGAPVEASGAPVEGAKGDPTSGDPELEQFKDVQTLRPIIGFLYESRGVRGLDAMEKAVRDSATTVKLVAKILRDSPQDLRKRVEKTMTTLEIIDKK